MQSFKDRLRIAWLPIPHLKLSLEANFLKWFAQTKRLSYFGKGTARWMFCVDLCLNHLFRAFSAGIQWNTQPWDTFPREPTTKCIASCNHDGSWEDDYCVLFFQVKFLIPTLRHMFCSPKPSNIYGESDSVSSVSRNKLEKYIFLWF